MSESPTTKSEIESARIPESAYRTNLKRINDLMKMGGSLSGHERNCAFLNLRGKSFATVSAAVGVDFPDDGRGLAISDWDGDGDLDYWTTNRTGPRIRLMLNNLKSDSSHLAIKLRGKSCNRDAIGSRVSVKLAGVDTPLIKTLRAGEGYLSQSSKTLHFGLGSSRAESVTVRWPGGDLESFVMPAGSSFTIEQGNPTPLGVELVAPRDLPKPLPSKNTRADKTDKVVLFNRIPVPRLPVLSRPDSPPVDALDDFAEDQPIAITLWASWCQQCLDELELFRDRSDEFRGAGLTVLAVNVDDSFSESEQANRSHDFLREDDASGESRLKVALGTKTIVERLRVLHELQFGRSMTMPVPVTFLINRKREVAVIYRGRTSADQLIHDAQQIDRPESSWASFVLPLQGRWNEPPKGLDILEVPRSMLELEQTQDAHDFVQKNEARLSINPEFSTLRAWLGASLVEDGDGLDGRRQIEKAIEASPDDLTIMNNLAWLAATHPDEAVRDGELAVKWGEKAARATNGNNATLLDTLAAAYAENGDFERALRMIDRAIRISGQANQLDLVEKFEARKKLYQQKQPFRE